jgi:hypothetical protein
MIRRSSRRIGLLRKSSICNSIEHMIGVTPEEGFTNQKLFSLYKVISTTFLVIGNAMLLPTLFVETSAQQINTTDFEITHGIASGDVTNQSAIIWSRVNDQSAQMNVEYDTNPNFTNPLRKSAQANSTTDFTAHAKLDGLKPDTQYYYRVWFSASDIVITQIVTQETIYPQLPILLNKLKLEHLGLLLASI